MTDGKRLYFNFLEGCEHISSIDRLSSPTLDIVSPDVRPIIGLSLSLFGGNTNLLAVHRIRFKTRGQ